MTRLEMPLWVSPQAFQEFFGYSVPRLLGLRNRVVRGSSRPCRPIGRSTRTRKPLANGRCPNHGGLSSGHKTAQGRERIAEAQRARWTRWRSKRLLKGLK